MKEHMELKGKWQVLLADGRRAEAELPGTLDENRIGDPDRPLRQWGGENASGREEESGFGENAIHTRLTRRYTYTGPAIFEREIDLEDVPADRRYVITVERSRKLALEVNGAPAATLLPGTLSTPWRFETEALRPGRNVLRFTADNSYPGWPAEAILYSSAATDETQTNWNGLLGEMRLEAKANVFLLDARMVIAPDGTSAALEAEAAVPREGRAREIEVLVHCEALAEPRQVFHAFAAEGIAELRFPNLRLDPKARRWRPEDPILYETEITVRSPGRNRNRTPSAEEMETDMIAIPAGIRTFGADDTGRLCLNGRRLFLRGETNCACYPETGHPPTDTVEWKEIIRRYQAYGVNCLRFHSHCPPEAAFTAADQLGMLMQPELSHWDPKEAFESESSLRYYRDEMREILRTMGKHPSFVMLSLGNELACSPEGEKRMAEMVREAAERLPDRLYARGSNAFYGVKGCDRESGFYTAQNYGSFQMRAISAAQDEAHPERKARIRGYLNNSYPETRTNYSEGMRALREKHAQPMFSFEVGQYETLPDFHEIPLYQGVTDPVNLKIIRRRAEKRGMAPIWDRMVEASGELALIGYREETEAAMRTPAMSGLSLLSIQDFPGQGTAIVGMMNAHLQPKPYDFAQPERFEAFFRDAAPLPEIERYTWEAGESLRAELRCANYSARDMGGTLRIELRGEDGRMYYSERRAGFSIPQGTADIRGTAEIPLPKVKEAMRAELTVYLEEEKERFTHTTPIWIYPKDEPEASAAKRESGKDAETGRTGAAAGSPGTPGDDESADILQAEQITEDVIRRLAQGGRVLLEPPSEESALPGSIRGQFTTDFWSVGTFPQQEGGMGLLIRDRHPLFRDFPTSFHTDYQWWLMAGQRAMRLPDERWAKGILVRQMDSYAQLRTFAMLLEARVGPGRILISSMGLKQLPQKPEVKALRRAMLRYMRSEAFAPEVSMTPEELMKLFEKGG